VVGGNKGEENKVEEPERIKSQQEQEMDRQIDATSAKDVEAFLRAQTASGGHKAS